MNLVDVNVLLYAVNRDAPRHATARRWLETAMTSTEAVGFAWVVLLAFLRLSTQPVFARPLEARRAIEIARGWLDQPPAVLVEPTPRHLGIVGGLLDETGSGGNLVSDAHLATLALEHDATIVSFDSDFGRFRGVRWTTPGA